VVEAGHLHLLEAGAGEEDRLRHLGEVEGVGDLRHRLGEEVGVERHCRLQRRQEVGEEEEHPCLVVGEEEEHRPCR
jgi:hypothetical protein